MLPHHLLAVFAPSLACGWRQNRHSILTPSNAKPRLEVHGQKGWPHMVHIQLHSLCRLQYATCVQEGFYGVVELFA